MLKPLRRLRLVALLSSLLVAPLTASFAAAPDITVFAAASMKNALDDVDSAFQKASGLTVSASYAASSVLARQIEQGAPADVFISADLDWMDDLAKHDLIQKDTRSTLLGNSLVLITQADKALTLDIKPGMDLAGALSGGRLALPLVDSVPAGKYGKAALTKLGIWSSVETSIAQAESVRAALAFVSRGEAPLGIVYSTDAAADPKVRIVGTFPEDTHPPIVYPIALTVSAKGPNATRYLAFLKTPEAATLFKAQGFRVLP